MTDAVATNEVAATEAKVELTLDQKIEALEARLGKLRQQKLTETMLSNVEKGDKVTIKFGRADKVRHINGEVIAVAIPNVVVLGEDLETFKVHVRDIIANQAASERVGVKDTAEIGADGRRPEEAGGSDPVEDMIAEGSPVTGDADNSADPLENA